MALQIAIIKQAAWSSTVHGGGKPRGLRLVYQAKGSILASMGQTATLLSPVQEGRIWRVRIVWANGAVHHFGKFASEKEAVDRRPSSTNKALDGRRAELTPQSCSIPQSTVA